MPTDSATERLDVSGEWWLPQRPDLKVTGRLLFHPESGVELRLIGSFRGMQKSGEPSTRDGVTTVVVTEASLEKAGRYDRVHGVAGSTAYTLDDCQRASFRTLLGGQETESIRASRLYTDVLFDSEEPPQATGVEFSLSRLEEWIGASGFRESFTVNDGQPVTDGPSIVLEAHQRPRQEATTLDGRQVVVTHRVGATGDGVRLRSLTQSFCLRVDTGALTSVDSLLDVASDVQDIVSIGLGRSSEFLMLRFFHPDLDQPLGRGPRAVPGAFGMLARWIVRDAYPPDERMHQDNMWFTFDQLGGAAGLARWLDTTAVYRGCLGRAMATIYSDSMYVSDRLLNCAAALESFDRRRTGYVNTKFKGRLQRCCDFVGQEYLAVIHDVVAWSERVRVERDDVAHHFERGISVTATEDQYFLARSLYVLFVICLLKESRAPAEVVSSVLTHADVRRVHKEIRRILSS